MPFGEYELSPSLIGLSLLHSAHPEAFQRLSVRTSIPCYRNFILAKCRSLGFASATSGSYALFRLAFTTARGLKPITLPETTTRRFIMQKARRHCIKAAPTACRRMVSGSLSLSLSECFSPFLHSTCTLSVSQEYLALADGPGGFAQNVSCSALLRITLGHLTLRVRDFHPLRYLFPKVSTHVPCSFLVLLLPRICITTHTVWALPSSLATTEGIIVIFSSCRY